jgi:hypothetical protein
LIKQLEPKLTGMRSSPDAYFESALRFLEDATARLTDVPRG